MTLARGKAEKPGAGARPTDTTKSDREALQRQLAETGYIADSQLAMALLLMRRLERPLLLEGEAGVGKTEVAKSLAQVIERPLIRLQCYEGLDAQAAVYEWNYQRQLLAIKLWENEARGAEEKERHIFTEAFLLERPLLRAIRQDEAPVLLIDEIDRADEEFEAFLLEVLSDYQVSVPELGTLAAKSIPFVILTSNGTRELSDALRRRCLYHYLDYPSIDRELRIVTARLPDLEPRLAGQLVHFVQAIRKEDLKREPGIAETLDWAAALIGLELGDLRDDTEALHDSLLCLLKTREDRAAIAPEVVERLVARAL